MRSIQIPRKDTALFYTGALHQAVPFLCQSNWENLNEVSVTVLLGKSTQQCEQWLEDMSFFHRIQNNTATAGFHIFPETPDVETAHPRLFEMNCDRITALSQLTHPAENRLVIAATPNSLFEPCPEPDALIENQIELHRRHSSIHPASSPPILGETPS